MSFNSIVLGNSPDLWLKFTDETDSSGNNRSVTNFGASLDADPLLGYGGAASFDGIDDRIEVSYFLNLDDTDGFSLFFVVSFDDLSDGHGIVDRYVAASSGWGVDISGGNLRARGYINSTEQTLTYAISNFAVGETHTVEIKWTGQVFSLIVDGTEQDSYDHGSSTTFTYGAVNDLIIGAYQDDTGFFNGYIDDLVYFTSPLSSGDSTDLAAEALANYITGSLTFSVPTPAFYPPGALEFSVPTPQIVLYGTLSTGVIAFDVPTPSLNLFGAGLIDFEVPTPSISLYGAGYLDFSVPQINLSMVGSLSPYGTLFFNLPTPRVSINGHIGTYGQLQFSVPTPIIELYGAGYLSFSIPVPDIFLSGSIQPTGTLAFDIPQISVSIAGTLGVIGTINFAVPVISFATGGTLSFSIPAISLSLAGDYGTYASYGVNIANGATTTYSMYQFEQIVMYQGEPYGIGADGIYKLTGTTDNGDAISASFTLYQSQLQSQNEFRVPDIFLHTRAEYLDVTVSMDEGTEYTYRTTQNASGKPQYVRAKPGLGLRGRNAQIKVANVDGGGFHVERIKIRQEILSRQR